MEVILKLNLSFVRTVLIDELIILFWFSEFEKFDKDRYKPIKLYSLYGINDNKLHITGTTGECAKFLNVPTYRINNAIRNNKLVVRGFKIIVN